MTQSENRERIYSKLIKKAHTVYPFCINCVKAEILPDNSHETVQQHFKDLKYWSPLIKNWDDSVILQKPDNIMFGKTRKNDLRASYSGHHHDGSVECMFIFNFSTSYSAN